MKVSHADQLTLLELQETDLQISRLGHRIQSNPLHEKLRELTGRAAELAAAEETATALRAQLPAAVLDEYDHLRGRLGVLVVLRFEEGRLVNAPLELNHAELAALTRAPKDELWEAEDSGYLVVRV